MVAILNLKSTLSTLNPSAPPLDSLWWGNSKVLLQQKFCLTLLRFYFLCDIKNAFNPMPSLRFPNSTELLGHTHTHTYMVSFWICVCV